MDSPFVDKYLVAILRRGKKLPEEIAAAIALLVSASPVVLWLDASHEGSHREGKLWSRHNELGGGKETVAVPGHVYGKTPDKMDAFIVTHPKPANPPGHDWRWERCTPTLTNLAKPGMLITIHH